MPISKPKTPKPKAKPAAKTAAKPKAKPKAATKPKAKTAAKPKAKAAAKPKSKPKLINKANAAPKKVSKRSDLPYRETSDVFLIYNGKLIAQNKGKYFVFPGGGIDKGESVETGAARELMEEVGVVLSGKLTNIATVDWEWFPAWAKTPKQKQRYKQFRGERSHLLIGEVKKIVSPTSEEGDAWSGVITYDISKVISIMHEQESNDHKNMYPYRVGQLAILNMLKAQLAK